MTLKLWEIHNFIFMNYECIQNFVKILKRAGMDDIDVHIMCNFMMT